MFLLSEDSKIAYPIEERMTIDGPPARVLDRDRSLLQVSRQLLDLVVPLKRVGEPGTLALERKVIVELEHLGIDCFRDNMISRCHSNGDRRVIHGLASLGGSLSGHQAAERKLPSRGIYQPPFESLDPSLGVVFDEHAAHATGRVLMEGIRPPLMRKTKCFGIQSCARDGSTRSSTHDWLEGQQQWRNLRAPRSDR